MTKTDDKDGWIEQAISEVLQTNPLKTWSRHEVVELLFSLKARSAQERAKAIDELVEKAKGRCFWDEIQEEKAIDISDLEVIAEEMKK